MDNDMETSSVATSHKSNWNDSANVTLRGVYERYENGSISKDEFKSMISKDVGIKLNPRVEHFIDSHYGGIGTFNRFVQVII